MKRLKFYLSIILSMCILSSNAAMVQASEMAEYSLKWIQNPVQGVTGYIYAPTPYGFIISTENGNALVNESGVLIPPSGKNFNSINEFGLIQYSINENNRYSSGIMDIAGNVVIPHGRYSQVSALSENRFIFGQSPDGTDDWSTLQWGVCDREGNVIVSPGKYAWLEGFLTAGVISGLIEASLEDGSPEFIDYDGNVIASGEEAYKVSATHKTDRYLYYDEAANKTHIRRLDGTDIAVIDGQAHFHPYDFIDVQVYEEDINRMSVYSYDVDGNPVDTVVYDDFGGMPYVAESIYAPKLKNYTHTDTEVYDKDNNVVYTASDIVISDVIADKYIKFYDRDWNKQGLMDLNGNVILPLGQYGNIRYSSNSDMFALESNSINLYDSSISLVKVMPITVNVNGTNVEFDQNPVIKDGRTLVPVRAIFEALGAEVNWDADTATVTSTLGGITVKLVIGSNVISVNDTSKELDVPAEIFNGRTLVPARAVSEAFGCTVEWNDDTKTVTISAK